MGRPFVGQNEAERFLRTRLADGTRNREDQGFGALARRYTQPFQATLHVVDDVEARQATKCYGMSLVDHGCCSTGLEG